MRVAFVHDWLTVYGGAERVLDAALELYPESPVYSLIYDRHAFDGTRIAQSRVTTSFLQRLPMALRRYRSYLPLMPMAIEQFDLSAHDVVISSSYAVAKGVLTRSHQLHVAYCHTPVRYAWDLYFPYLAESGLERGVKGQLARLILHYLRLWDAASALRADVLVANSHFVARRIWKTYRREAHVIHPPVEVDRFQARRDRSDFYLTVSRLVPYKRVDLIVRAFSRAGLPLVVIGDGPDLPRIERMAGPSVRLLGRQPDQVVAEHMERAKAFVFAAEEDFGITPVEAQAAGAPVIAFGRGGVTESVVPGRTGELFLEQSEASLLEAVGRFEAGARRYDPPERIRERVERFGRPRFQRELARLVERAWAEHRAWGPGEATHEPVESVR